MLIGIRHIDRPPADPWVSLRVRLQALSGQICESSVIILERYLDGEVVEGGQPGIAAVPGLALAVGRPVLAEQADDLGMAFGAVGDPQEGDAIVDDADQRK